MNEEAPQQVDVIEPLIDRVRELGEVRGHLDEPGYDTRAAHEVYELLADCLPQVVTIVAVTGSAGMGKTALACYWAAAVAEADESPASTESGALPACDTSLEGADRCNALIDGLDEVATAALIARSSLGTPTARRIRRKTSPGNLASILRRRDELTASEHQTPPGEADMEQPEPETVPPANADASHAVPHALNCPDVLDRVYSYLDGQLGENGRAEIRQHLDECGPCLREYGLEEAVERLVHRQCGHNAVPEDLRIKVLTRVQKIAAELRQPEPTTGKGSSNPG